MVYCHVLFALDEHTVMDQTVDPRIGQEQRRRQCLSICKHELLPTKLHHTMFTRLYLILSPQGIYTLLIGKPLTNKKQPLLRASWSCEQLCCHDQQEATTSQGVNNCAQALIKKSKVAGRNMQKPHRIATPMRTTVEQLTKRKNSQMKNFK